MWTFTASRCASFRVVEGVEVVALEVVAVVVVIVGVADIASPDVSTSAWPEATLSRLVSPTGAPSL